MNFYFRQEKSNLEISPEPFRISLATFASLARTAARSVLKLEKSINQ